MSLLASTYSALVGQLPMPYEDGKAWVTGDLRFPKDATGRLLAPPYVMDTKRLHTPSFGTLLAFCQGREGYAQNVNKWNQWRNCAQVSVVGCLEQPASSRLTGDVTTRRITPSCRQLVSLI